MDEPKNQVVDNTAAPVPPPGPLVVMIYHEIFSEYFTLVLPGDQTEEVDTQEALAWFKDHGANMDIAQKALDHAWNMGKAGLTIQKPKQPSNRSLPFAPQI